MSAQQQIEAWLDKIVIGLNLCPFAKYPRQNDQVEIHVCEATSIEELLCFLIEKTEQLKSTSANKLDTILVVAANMLDDFDEYLDCLFLAEQLFEQQGWQGLFQIAGFHPKYQFKDTEPDDLENLSNRAPFPIFHVLREQSLSKAIEYHGDTSSIPENNKRCLNALNEEKRRCLFNYLAP